MEASPAEQLAVIRGSRTLALVAGLIALGAGVVVLDWPDRTVVVVARIVGIFLIVGGLAQVLDALVTHRKGTYWGLLLARGLIDLAVGVAAVFWPSITVWALVLLIGLELIIGGLVSLVIAFRLPNDLEQHSRFMWRGILSIIGGLILLVWPDQTVAVVAVVLGVYLVVMGLVLLFAAFELGKAERHAPGV